MTRVTQLKIDWDAFLIEHGVKRKATVEEKEHIRQEIILAKAMEGEN